MEIFCVLIVGVVTELYVFVKMQNCTHRKGELYPNNPNFFLKSEMKVPDT